MRHDLNALLDDGAGRIQLSTEGLVVDRDSLLKPSQEIAPRPNAKKDG